MEGQTSHIHADSKRARHEAQSAIQRIDALNDRKNLKPALESLDPRNLNSEIFDSTTDARAPMSDTIRALQETARKSRELALKTKRKSALKN